MTKEELLKPIIPAERARAERIIDKYGDMPPEQLFRIMAKDIMENSPELAKEIIEKANKK